MNLSPDEINERINRTLADSAVARDLAFAQLASACEQTNSCRSGDGPHTP